MTETLFGEVYKLSPDSTTQTILNYHQTPLTNVVILPECEQ